MPVLTVQVNTKKIQKNIEKYTADKLKEIRDVINASALQIQADAKRKCPVNINRLRSSIAIETITQTSTEYVLRVGTNVFYAPYVEFGTGIFAVNGDGRKTPWAFKKTNTMKKYKFKTIDIEGQEYFVTRGSKPHPFLFPAYEKERPNYDKELKKVLKK